jgi:hypothetical protein
VKTTATIHEASSATPHDPEDAAGVFPGDRFREPDRHEAGHRHQRAGEHRQGGRAVGEGRGAGAVPALFDLHHHHFHGDDRVVDQQAERDDQRPERDAVERPTRRVHHRSDDAQHQRHRRRDHDAAAPAQRQEAHREHDGQRLQERLLELPHRFIDDARLIGVFLQGHAQRQAGLQGRGGGIELLANLEKIHLTRQHDAERDHRLAVVAHGEPRRVFVA